MAVIIDYLFAILIVVFEFLAMSFNGVFHSICEVDDVADYEPNSKSNPRIDVKLEHKIQISENTEQWKKRHDWHFETCFEITFWLTRNHNKKDQQQYTDYNQSYLQCQTVDPIEAEKQAKNRSEHREQNDRHLRYVRGQFIRMLRRA